MSSVSMCYNLSPLLLNSLSIFSLLLPGAYFLCSHWCTLVCIQLILLDQAWLICLWAFSSVLRVMPCSHLPWTKLGHSAWPGMDIISNPNLHTPYKIPSTTRRGALPPLRAVTLLLARLSHRASLDMLVCWFPVSSTWSLPSACLAHFSDP